MCITFHIVFKVMIHMNYRYFVNTFQFLLLRNFIKNKLVPLVGLKCSDNISVPYLKKKLKNVIVKWYLHRAISDACSLLMLK